MPGGRAYHLNIGPKEIPDKVLLPGDPDRVSVIAGYLDTAEPISHHREYCSMKGTYCGKDIGICSTGIGAPSTAIAVEELAHVGASTFVRVGSTGALREDIGCGDIIISSGSMRLEGTSSHYVPEGYPAFAHYETVMALIEACEVLGARYHVGVSASTDSFYTGQGRPGYGGFIPPSKRNVVEEYSKCGILNFEMESSVIFTLASIYGLRAGCVCTVFANRITDEFITKGEDVASQVGIEAMKILCEWDEAKQAKGKDHFYCSLR